MHRVRPHAPPRCSFAWLVVERPRDSLVNPPIHRPPEVPQHTRHCGKLARLAHHLPLPQNAATTYALDTNFRAYYGRNTLTGMYEAHHH